MLPDHSLVRDRVAGLARSGSSSASRSSGVDRRVAAASGVRQQRGQRAGDRQRQRPGGHAALVYVRGAAGAVAGCRKALRAAVRGMLAAPMRGQRGFALTLLVACAAGCSDPAVPGDLRASRRRRPVPIRPPATPPRSARSSRPTASRCHGPGGVESNKPLTSWAEAAHVRRRAAAGLLLRLMPPPAEPQLTDPAARAALLGWLNAWPRIIEGRARAVARCAQGTWTKNAAWPCGESSGASLQFS